MVLMGHFYILLLIALVVMLAAEFIRRSGNYKSFKMNVLANGVFSMWAGGSLTQLLFVKERYMEMTTKMMGEEYAQTLERLVTLPNLTLVYIGAFVGGVLGGLLGYKMLKKHFEKAGIV